MSEGEGSAPAEAGTTEASAAESAIPSRPDFVPEKFWNAESGEVRLEDAFKSYSEIEKKGRQRGDKMREEIMAEIEAETTANRPETMDDYELVVPEFLQEQLGEDDTYEFNQDDPLLHFWKETAHELGFGQEDFNKGVEAYVNAQMAMQPDLEAEIAKLGENGQDRAAHVAQWAEKTFSPETYQALFNFAQSADSIVALEEVMGLANEPAFIPSNGGDGTQHLSLAQLKEMQKDRRYNDPAHFDHEFVKKVTEGFERLYPDQ
tara:strand:- start:652 stop:1437 length:786 start_codon:yes stop_codon:yes gene_type:complete